MCMKFIYWITFCVFRFTAGVFHITHVQQLPLFYHHSTATVYAGEDDVDCFV